MTRQEFIKGMAAAAALSGCKSRECGLTAGGYDAKKRWYKGNLHTHTMWSDGKAFPEEAVAWYKSRGYNFLGLSDHNLFQDDTDRWTEVIGDNEKYEMPKNTGTGFFRSFGIYSSIFRKRACPPLEHRITICRRVARPSNASGSSETMSKSRYLQRPGIGP